MNGKNHQRYEVVPEFTEMADSTYFVQIPFCTTSLKGWYFSDFPFTSFMGGDLE